MIDLYADAGPLGPTLLGAAALVVVIGILHGLLWMLRWRPPAFFVWSMAAVALMTAGVASIMGWNGADPIWRPLPGSPPNAPELYASGMKLAPLALGAFAVSAALTVTGVLLGMANIVTPGDGAKWTVKHSCVGIGLGGIGALGGLLAWPAGLIGGFGGLAIGVSALRIGRRADGRRMAAGRGFVAGLFASAAGCLGLGYAAHHLHLRLVAWADGADHVDAGLAVLGTTFTACLVLLAGVLVMLPHAKRVLDGRAAMGTLFSLFLLAPVAASTVPPLQRAASYTQPDAAANRQLALRRLGIELIPIDGDPWTQELALTVGPYWAFWQDERLVPFRGGQVPSSAKLNGVAVDALDRFTAIGTGTVAFEIDRDVDMLRLRPLFAAARRAELYEIRIVTRNDLGALRTRRLSVAPAPEDGLHVLMGPGVLTWIEGETVRDTTLAELAGKTLVLHADDLVMAPELLEIVKIAEVTLWL